MIYLAGSCSSENRTIMMRIAKTLRFYEYQVFCPFELNIPDAWSYSQEEWSQKVFNSDLAALNEADTFIMVTPGRESTAGTNWEHGYAFANHKRIIVAQYTEEPTSLMTWCACDRFIHTTEETIHADILDAMVNMFIRPHDTKGLCSTILT